MNWVAPIKEEETLRRYKRELRKKGLKYSIMFELGSETGMSLKDLLNLRIKDLKDKDTLTALIGKQNCQISYVLPDALKQDIAKLTAGQDPEEYLFRRSSNHGNALTRETVFRVMKKAGLDAGLRSIGAQTMRKTFAWRYYKRTGDIYYLQHLFNHASPSITYRYIGVKPQLENQRQKITSEENRASRLNLLLDNRGDKKLRDAVAVLESIRESLKDPLNDDSFYGRVDGLLEELELLLAGYSKTA